MDSKKVIEKLVKIADNQQKVINKLAQAMGMEPMPLGGATTSWADVSQDFQNKMHAVPQARNYSVVSAEAAPQSGALAVKIHLPKEDPMFHKVVDALKGQLVGQAIKTNDGKEVHLSDNPHNLNITATWG